MLGALLIATVSNGMTLLSVPSFWQPLVIGLIILLGVIVDTYRRRFSEVRQAIRVLRSRAGGKTDQNQEHATGSAGDNVNSEPGIPNSSPRL
jgi:ribose transport system permease protein